jgi:hypothetical protein
MGLSVGWSRDDYRAAATVTDPQGRKFANVCIGCDAFFATRLGDDLAVIRAARMAKLAATA